MGRPLSKKYFGSRNPGRDGNYGAANTAGDAGLGGAGIESITVNGTGDGWTVQPTYVVEAPQMADGITAQVVAHYQALSFATTANGTGYRVGDVVEVHTGTASTKARAPVSAITIIGTPHINNGGNNLDPGNGTNGDQVTYSHSNFSTPLTVKVTAGTSGHATSIVVVNPGVWTGTGAPPTTIAGGSNGFTATCHDGPIDNNGAGLVLDNLVWGAYSFGAPSVPGNYTVFPSTGAAGVLDTITGSGTGAKATITLGLLGFDVTNPGDGYEIAVSEGAYIVTGGPLVSFTPDANASYDVYAVAPESYSFTDVSRAITVYGYSPVELLSAVPYLPVNIIKQVSSRRYKTRERQFASLTSAQYGVLTATNTHGAFSISIPQPAGTFAVGSYVVIHGNLTGAGSIGGYYSGCYYEVTATNGTSTFTLKNVHGDLTTVAGQIDGAVILSEEVANRPLIEQSAQLVGHWPQNPGEIAILAMDYTSSLYFVTKLTAHRALLVPMSAFNDAWIFAPNSGATDGSDWPAGEYKSAAWTLDYSKVTEQTADSLVWIQNFDILAYYG